MSTKTIGWLLAFSALSAVNASAQIATQGPDAAITPAAAGQSKVLVYRGDKGYYGVMRPAYVSVNGERVASLSRNQHTVFCVSPGTQVLGTHLEDAWIYSAKNRRDQTVNFEGGKTYLFKVQDEERERYTAAINVDAATMQRETLSSGKVDANLDNTGISRVVPCAVFVAPQSVALAPKVMNREMTLGADALFVFDRSGKQDLLPPGRAKLDALARDLRDMDVQRIHVTGHTDRLGEESYNQRLSQARAETVKAYLADQGVSAAAITTEGRGKREPVQECNLMGREALINCLQPNRRVVLQISAKSRK